MAVFFMSKTKKCTGLYRFFCFTIKVRRQSGKSATKRRNMAKGASDILKNTVDISSVTKENGKVKRKRRIKKIREESTFKEAFFDILSLEVPSDALCDAVKNSPLGEKINYKEAILLAQIIKATNGDTQAATFVRDTSGNKIKEAESERTVKKRFEDFF